MIETKERGWGERGKMDRAGFPREKILLLALKRELSEAEIHELDSPVVRRLIVECFRQIKLDF